MFVTSRGRFIPSVLGFFSLFLYWHPVLHFFMSTSFEIRILFLSRFSIVKLHNNNDVYMVPLSTLAGPCFVVYNQNYTSSRASNSNIIDDRTAYVVKPMREWGDEFLPSLS